MRAGALGHAIVACVGAAFAAALSLAAAQIAVAGETRAIDAAHSSAQFGVQHIFVERVTGAVPIQSGTVVLEGGSAIPRSVSAVLDASRITTGDPDQTAALRGPDFFDAARFPTWTFVGTAIVPRGANAFGLDGMLTMHGVTQPEHLDVTVAGDAEHPVYTAVGHVDRHAFGMSVTRLDPVIGGTVDVTLTVVLVAPAGT
ncbi:MAG: YceI family protein [Vulcanimicrobiaceae bacterium]